MKLEVASYTVEKPNPLLVEVVPNLGEEGVDLWGRVWSRMKACRIIGLHNLFMKMIDLRTLAARSVNEQERISRNTSHTVHTVAAADVSRNINSMFQS